jgi:hypothetical protein
MESIISLRTAFPEGQPFGESVHTLPKRKGGDATAEIEALSNEIARTFGVEI